VAYERRSGAERVVVVAPRRVLGLRAGWGDTVLELPPRRTYRDVLGGGRHEGGTVALEALLARFPVALLACDTEHEA
jgi:maltooligosyltrehalose synthase